MQSSVLIKHHINTQTPVRNVCLKCTIEKKILKDTLLKWKCSVTLFFWGEMPVMIIKVN